MLLLGATQVAQGSWIHVKALVAQQLLQQAWLRGQQSGLIEKPWPWADTHPVARLQVPRLGIDQIVLEGNHGQALAFGPGLASESVMPGTEGVMLISGHRDTHFRFMRNLRVGDQVRVDSISGEHLAYRVTDTRVVNAHDLYLQSDNTHKLLLATCWPFNSAVLGGQWRFVVIAEPVLPVTVARVAFVAKRGGLYGGY